MVSVIIPTLNEEKRIAEIVKYCLSSRYTHEVIVIDDGSIDRTVTLATTAGAKVFFSSMLGKGTSMLDGLWRAQSDNVLFLDGDIHNFSTDLIEKMTKPLFDNTSDFVKGRFQRAAGRVTALTAKPLLQAFFPEISHIEQPLGGIIAAKKELLRTVKFEMDYGVDIGLLIDIAQLGARISEVDIGSIDHDHQSLQQLGNMSTQVTKVILDRASRYKKMNMSQIKDSYEILRVNQLQTESILCKIDPQKKLALFDMDGTLVDGRFIERIARYAGQESQLSLLLDNERIDPVFRTKQIAKILTGLPKSVFEKVAQIIPLAKNAQNLVVELKKRGFTVGIITDSYFVASEVIRKRVFADFSIAHLLEFKGGIFTGNIQISPLFISDKCKIHNFCKLNFLNHIDHFYGMNKSLIHFAGDGLNDICLLKNIPQSFAINPKNSLVKSAAKNTAIELDDILNHWV